MNPCLHAAAAAAVDWIDLKLKASDVPFGKNTKTVELAAGKVLMLYKFENMVRLRRYSQPCCCLAVVRCSPDIVRAWQPRQRELARPAQAWLQSAA
jgi:hypothetical protein